jgi:putative transposase
MATARRARQNELPFPNTWGGRRKGAGRNPGPRPSTPHRARPFHDRAQPVHATLRVRPEAGSLRTPRTFAALRDALARASRRNFRVVHFSVQDDHAHLLVEASTTAALVSGMRGLAVRTALAVNRARGRTGRVWAQRWHGRALASPRDVRNALVYVLQNWLKHDRRAMGLDPYSLARWLNGWRGRPARPKELPPVAAPETWLLARGWKRHGLLSGDETPRSG